MDSLPKNEDIRYRHGTGNERNYECMVLLFGSKEQLLMLSQNTKSLDLLVINWVSEGRNINEKNGDEQTLLHCACQYLLDFFHYFSLDQATYDNEVVARWLVEQRADVAVIDKKGWTPLTCALQVQNLDLANVRFRVGYISGYSQ